MTLIAIHTTDEGAEFITDSLSYTRNLSRFSASSKSTVLHHINTAVLSSGDGMFGDEAKSVLRLVSSNFVSDYDGMLAESPRVLRDLWKSVNDFGNNAEVYESTVFLIGHSAAAGGFRCHHLSTEQDFEPVLLEGMYVSPSPANYRPSDIEMSRLLAKEGSDPRFKQFLTDVWQTKPERSVPASLLDWGMVAIEAQSRATQDVAKMLVGGSIFYTSMDEDGHSTRKLLELEYEDEDFLAFVGYSQHPAAQERPCWCGSGERHIDCHQAEHLEMPCGCGHPTKTFFECCAVAA